VDLISGPTFGPEGSIEEAVQAAAIPIRRIRGLVREVRPVQDIAALVQLTRMLRGGHYHIVHTHTSKAGFIGRIAARLAGVPVIIHTPHGNIFDGYFSPVKTRMFMWMEQFASRFTDRIIELTSGGIEENLAAGIGRPEQFTVIFSGIDLSPYDAAIVRRETTRAALGADPETILVGGVGRLETVKGFAYFVEAAREASRSNPRLKFVLAGQGSLEAELRDSARDMGDRFVFLGPRNDVPDIMAALDIFVLPSLNEGMGRVLLEAGAAGAPSVATRVGGVPDVIRDGKTGILTPVRDGIALARGISALAENVALRSEMGREARDFVVPAYSLENMVQKLETLYETVLEEKSRGI
jgi:glycosyltransferase involved in cell wall biosynthesis